MKHPFSNRADPDPRSTPWEIISLMVATDVKPVLEIAARFVLLAIFCISAAIWLDMALAVYWLLVYMLAETVNIAFLATRRAPASRAEEWLATGLNFVTTLWFATLPVYLWQFESQVLKFAAVSLLAGMVIYSVTRYSGLRRIVIWDGLLISAIALYFGYDLARHAEGTVTMALSMLFSVLLVAYFLISLQENLTAQRALKQAEKRHVQAQKMEAVGQLTGGIAHDFNNLLTVMIGNLDLYQEVSDPSEKDMLADEARQAALRAATLTSQLLAFSHKARLDPRPVNPARLLENFTAMTTRVLPDSVTLQLELADPPQSVTVDVHQLENALLNLVINARDAMEDNGIVTIGLDRIQTRHAREFGGVRLSPGVYARISVTDTGPGIAPEDLGTVTEPFFTTKQVGKGSGLGLSMAKGFVEQSGGALELTSTPGQGATFAFWLPSQTPEDDDQEGACP
ncbi:ATP-binding protein [Alterinioella nitratireducens]|uniref:ATP-binding protein n=1 Tax=Alterinioella nitratireducens TaxID=2735915 RepID=UPI001555D3CA|nr:ATP-binding protein [Alterinioella nitratireducens]NPD19186.1 hypothetical protein [Alterinioella nitratireducens]